MAETGDIGARTQQAILANLRQQLLTPASALVSYSELLLEQAQEAHLQDMLPDINRILTAAQNLSQIVDNLLDEKEVRKILAAENIEQAERQLRHDLRTPINAVKGYSELLLEDLEDLEELSADNLRVDFRHLLSEADNLLGKLDSIVVLSTIGKVDIAGETEASMSHLIESIVPVDESNLKDETGYILVVDDIEANRDLLARRLLKEGHRVLTAADGKEALIRLEQEEFDLVLLDLMMPGMNGFEVLQRIKSHQDMRNVPVIMVSALNETDSVVRCIEAGAHDYLLKPVNPVLLKARIVSALESKQWSDQERQQRQYIRQAFSRFVSPSVVDQLLNSPENLSLGGERLDITCVFTDLAGFTSLIEGAEPSAVLPVLNRYLDGLCRIMLEHDGTIDKIVGDALHGFFGAPAEQADHAAKAMRCVLALDEYARNFINEPEASALGFGITRIGVHSGFAVVGNFGGDAFFDYTAHGDVINTAARLESANKHIGTTICVSANTAEQCDDIAFRPIGRLLLKGKSEGVQTREPVTREQARLPIFNEYCKAYQLMAANKSEAGKVFTRLAKKYPADPLIALHAGRLQAGEQGDLLVLAGK